MPALLDKEFLPGQLQEQEIVLGLLARKFGIIAVFFCAQPSPYNSKDDFLLDSGVVLIYASKKELACWSEIPLNLKGELLCGFYFAVH
jgi:hypothetical protein